jgi:chaperonin GroES
LKIYPLRINNIQKLNIKEGNNMEIKPLGKRVLVKPENSEEKTKGGLYIPDSAKEKNSQGIIIAIGDSDDIKVKVKDKVMFESYAGTEVKIDGEKYMLMDYKEILAIIK